MKRIAIIDLGSNSIRFIIMEIGDGGSYKLIYQEKKTIRLAEGMNACHNRLTEDSQKRAIDCMKVYAHIAAVQQVDKTIAVATAAVRNAINGASFLKRARTVTGIPMTVISGRAEAALGFSGVIHTIDMDDFLLFDLGGASVEISLVRRKKRLRSVSLPIGAVTLTETFQSVGSVPPQKLKDMRRFIQEYLKTLSWLPKKPLPVIAIGGTVRNLAKVHQRLTHYPLSKLHRYQMEAPDLLALIDHICSLPLPARRKLSGLSYERADIIIAGSLIVSEILRACGADTLTVSGCGLREGLFFHYYNKHYGHIGGDKTDMLLSSVRNYLGTLTQKEPLHSPYVTAMALSLFDQWQEEHHLSPRMRTLLTAAGLLHDVGVKINYYGHARHGAYIAANAHIFGWTQKEQLLCAFLISFHHGYSGKVRRTSPFFPLFTEAEWKEIKMASLLLALAEALDESYEQCVGRLTCRTDAKEMELCVFVNGDSYDVPAHATLPLLPAFAKLFNKPLHIQWFPNSRTRTLQEAAKHISP